MLKATGAALLLLVTIGSAAQDRDRSYAYDGAGNITHAGAETFTYDEFGRIEKATIAGITQTFTYDRHGNITKIATTGENDRIIGVNSQNQLSDARYDGSGNLLQYRAERSPMTA